MMTYTFTKVAITCSTKIINPSLWFLQVSQYTFAMCSYREKKPDPTEMMQLDGFTVDYCEPLPGKLTFLQTSCKAGLIRLHM